tara:strand:+ start:351 stop:779 length:429 start_codon:yes stop_codon:yes gene_type:complete
MEGSDNMKTQEAAREDKQESASLADRLPELDEEHMLWAQGTPQRAWAYGKLSAGAGYVWTMPDYGLALQVASEDTMRLLTVTDHEWSISTVAYIMATLDCLGLKMDLSQAIVAPYVEDVDNATGPEADAPVTEDGTSGVEVV